MQEKNQIQVKITKFHLALLFSTIIALVVAVPVLAGSSGTTSRTTTTTVCTTECAGGTCSYVGSKIFPAEDPPTHYCTLELFAPYNSVTDQNECFPASSVRGWFTASECGWPDGAPNVYPDTIVLTGFVCTQNQKVCNTVTVSLPEATIDSSITGGTLGSNGWYTAAPTVQINAVENMVGQSIIGIEGHLDGVSFYCSGATCTIPITNNGSHSLNYRAISDYGDKTSYGDVVVNLDTELPAVNGNATGTVGSNNWFISAVNLTVSGTDGVSGMSVADIQVDGGLWAANVSILSTDGSHSVVFRSTDLAGNETTTSGTILVDLTAPTLNLLPSGTLGNNGWYTANAQVAANEADAASGIAIVQMQVDNGGWQTVNSMPLNDGIYSIEAQATNNAGLDASAGPIIVKVDSTLPLLNPSIIGTAGSNGWYTSANVDVVINPSDATSGVASSQIQVDGGGWQAVNTVTIGGEGGHSVDLEAVDNAGNLLSQSQTIMIDSIAPAVSFDSPASGRRLEGSVTLSGGSSDVTSGVAKVQIKIGGGNWQDVAVDVGGAWSYAWDTTQNRNNSYSVQVRAVDAAGNLSGSISHSYRVLNKTPFINIPDSWPIWETVLVEVSAGANPVSKVYITISDPQGRWPEQVNVYVGGNIPTEFQWNRYFGDGTAAPIGEYDVLAEVWDTTGNHSADQGLVMIPDPAPVVVETIEETPTAEPQAVIVPDEDPPAQPIADPTQEPQEESFSFEDSGGTVPQPQAPAMQVSGQGIPLWGGAAVALSAAATAYALARKRKREEEEERQRAIARARARARQAAKASSYTVQSGDSYALIAGKVYGNQRMFEQLMAANGDRALRPGDKIYLPQVSNEVAANPHISQSTMDYFSSQAAPQTPIQAVEVEKKPSRDSLEKMDRYDEKYGFLFPFQGVDEGQWDKTDDADTVSLPPKVFKKLIEQFEEELPEIHKDQWIEANDGRINGLPKRIIQKNTRIARKKMASFRQDNTLDTVRVGNKPPGIVWGSALWAKSLEYIGKNQYWIDANPYDSKLEFIEQLFGYNACGPIALSMILEANTDNENVLYSLYEYEEFKHNKATTPEELARLLVKYANEVGSTGWKNKINSFSNSWSITRKETIKDKLIEVDYVEENYNEDNPDYYKTPDINYYNWMKSTLDQGHHYISFVAMKADGVLAPDLKQNHWVVVTGLSENWDLDNMESENNWIRIMNPFTNQEEYYLWSEWQETVHPSIGLEVWNGD